MILHCEAFAPPWGLIALTAGTAGVLGGLLFAGTVGLGLLWGDTLRETWLRWFGGS